MANSNQSELDLVHMHRSRGDNIQKILRTIGQVRAK